LAGGNQFPDSSQPFTAGRWYHATITLGPGGKNVHIYMNGQQGLSDTSQWATLPTSGDLSLGSLGSGSYWNGALDEARLSSVVRSPNWIWACYMNQASNSVFSGYQIQASSTPPTGTTVHGIPYSWLANYGIATNDSVETQHMNGHSLNVLQDYIAGMNPTNPNSCFMVSVTNSAGQVIIQMPSVQGTDGKTRYYDIELRTNLMFGSWQPVPGYTNVLGNGSIILYTNGIQDPAKFYRVKARLQ
jgi:hypothetical protein